MAAHLGLTYFFYEDGSRSEDVILDEIEGYEGVIQSDGLGAYKKVAVRSEGKILRLSCLQHCKRPFVDMKGNPDADEILALAVRMYDNLKRAEGDNPTIGLILCTETSKDIAKYSVLHENPQLFAAKYLTYLPSEEDLKREIEKQKEIFQIQQGEI